MLFAGDLLKTSGTGLPWYSRESGGIDAYLKSLGKKLKEEHTNFKTDTDLFVGMKTAVVDDKDIMDLLSNKKTKFKGKYLVFVPADEDLSKIKWDGQDHLTRKIIIQSKK